MMGNVDVHARRPSSWPPHTSVMDMSPELDPHPRDDVPLKSCRKLKCTEASPNHESCAGLHPEIEYFWCFWLVVLG